jgi:glycosyltransferase involved in cell wall biosynthesis
MKVGIDATPLLGTRTGVGGYVAGLLDGFVSLGVAPPLLTAFTWRGVDTLPAGWPRAPRRFSARALQAAWLRTDWPPVEWLTGRLDVFHGTNFVLPPTRRARGVVTVHDLAYDLHADTVTPASLRYRTLVPRALYRGTICLTPSRTVADEVRDRYSVDPGRVVPTPLGEYLLFVGSREPRKNLPVLLDALRLLPDAPPLVVAGPRGWGADVDPSRVVLTGYLDGPRLASVVAGARAFVFPSRYEGFGLPPLEALATGTPVVASDLPVLREVLGDRAAYAPVGDAEALAAAIGQALHDGDGGAAGRAARAAHAAAYTWERCARATLAAYDLA